MRLLKLFKSKQGTAKQNAQRKFSDSKTFRAVISLSILAALAVTFTMIRQTVTVNAQQVSENIEALSLFDASAAADRLKGQTELTEQPSPPAQFDNPSQIAPDGSVCGWSASTAYPVPILDQASTSVGSSMYVFGGVSTAIQANARKFDGTTWTDIAPLPAALEFPTAVSDGTNIYILGGALIGTGTPQTTLYRYNVALNTYTTLAPFTTGTWNSAAVFLGGKIYKFAGTGPATASTNVLEIYDVAGNTWTTGAPYPLSISFVGAFVRGGFIYGAGGILSVGSVASDKTYRYDPGTNTWDDAAITDLPATRWAAASSINSYGVNNGWVLAGGYVAGTVTANISTSVIRWNPTTNVWDTLTPMSGERARMTGAVLGGSFYVIGGRSVASAAFVGTNDNQKLLCFSGVAVISSGTAAIVSESYPPANNAPDPGETVSVSLPLQNVGDTATTNLTATLQATGGVTNPSPAAQNYGILPPMGAATTKNFTFRVDPAVACGSTITLTWVINDGATNYPNVVKTFIVGTPLSVTEKFDGVVAPALPAGWATTNTGAGPPALWTTTATGPNSAPNSAFTNDPATIGESSLESLPISISSTSSRLSFKNKYITESGFDGMVLEIKIGAGAYADIVTAGGAFVSGGYNGTISTAFMNPFAGRAAWTGTSAGGYVDSVVTLPAAANGQMVQFKWRMGSDSSVAATGVNIDDVSVLNGYSCVAAPLANPRADFDGDGKTDLSVFRPSEGNWYLQRSTAGLNVINWGMPTDTIIPGDYDGDGKTDTAVFRPDAAAANPDYLILRSNGFVFQGVSWGLPADVAVNGDYDGDGKTDLAVFRPSNGTWYVLNSSGSPANTVAPFGLTGDVPLAIDDDGDGKTNLAVFRPSNFTWYIAKPTGTPATNFSAYPFGLAGDRLVQADYDGDNRDDIAVFRPSNGTWYIRKASDGSTLIQAFGISGDVPVPGDYDGDGKDDVAVYRAGVWYVNRSTAGLFQSAFGLATDVPVPARYLPGAPGGGGAGTTVSYTGPAVAITDNTPAGINIVVPVAGVGTISDLNFSFDGTAASADPLSTTVGLNHSWVGDIIVKLTSPGGTIVTIVDRPGVPTTTTGCNNNNFFGTTLNDDGGLPAIEIQANPVGGPCNTALAFPVGNFSPNNPMSAFDGQNANGNWTVNVSDNAGADTGSVRAFSLIFNSGN